MLEQEGLRVVTAEDGPLALDMVESEEPDLVLLDVVMPTLSGLEVCRRLKASPGTRLLPIILVTGLDARPDRLAGIEAGADDFLSKPFDRAELIARVRSLLRIKRYTDELERAESVLMALALTIEERDPYTRGHCDRLAVLSSALGRRLELAPPQLIALERGGYLHDIGKITVPDAILQKAGRLTPEERESMRKHPEAGERICRGLRSLLPVLPIIRHHHERLDGSGYPDGLAGDDIPLSARILQIVDVYDALTTRRPYKSAMSQAVAVATMEEEVRKGWWDPAIFAEFRDMLGDGISPHANVQASAPPPTRTARAR
jgi:putative two-component system response regulator